MCVGFTVNLVLPVEEQLNNNRIVSIIKIVGKLGHIYTQDSMKSAILTVMLLKIAHRLKIDTSEL